MINIHWLELPLSRIYFHGSKGVRAIEVLLYAVTPHDYCDGQKLSPNLKMQHPCVTMSFYFQKSVMSDIFDAEEDSDSKGIAKIFVFLVSRLPITRKCKDF